MNDHHPSALKRSSVKDISRLIYLANYWINTSRKMSSLNARIFPVQVKALKSKLAPLIEIKRQLRARRLRRWGH
jgi:hypothetical protein